MPTQLPDTSTCLGCGYLLRELPGRYCPECGRAFNPEDATTYRNGPAVAPWRRWARPPGIWHHFAVFVVTLLVLNVWSGAGGLLLFCAALAAGPFLLVVYLMRAVAACMDRARADLDRDPHMRSKWSRWLVTPICLSLMISAGLTRWPMQLRFAASRRALEAEATRLLAQAGPASPGFLMYGRFVGLYYVHYVSVEQSPPSVHFITDSGPIDGSGFLYCPGRARGNDVGLPDGWSFSED